MSVVSLKTVFGRGINSLGQLGLNNKYQNSEEFVPIPGLSRLPIKSLQASWAQSACLLEDNMFLSWGWPLDVRSQMQALWVIQDNYKMFRFIQRYSPLPWISYREGIDEPTPLLLPESIVQFSIGGAFTLAIDNEGYAYGWGENHRGQLGLGHAKYQHSPIGIAELLSYRVRQVASGYQHSLFLTEDGEVFAVGRSTYSAIGTAPLNLIQPNEFIHLPIQVPITNVSKVAAGNSFSLFLTEQGEVFGLGKNDMGQCGQVNNLAVVERPTQLFFPERVVDIAAGSKHAFALSASGTVYGWGSRMHGQLDGFKDGMFQEQCSPAPLELPIKSKIKQIKASFDRSCAIMETGEVLVWGGQDNSINEGENYEGFVLLNPLIPHQEIEDVALGFMHTLVLTAAK